VLLSVLSLCVHVSVVPTMGLSGSNLGVAFFLPRPLNVEAEFMTRRRSSVKERSPGRAVGRLVPGLCVVFCGLRWGSLPLRFVPGGLGALGVLGRLFCTFWCGGCVWVVSGMALSWLPIMLRGSLAVELG